MPKPDADPGLYFQLFNEIGIIEQLSRALFEARLPHGFLVSHFSVLNHLVRLGDGKTPLEIARAFQVPKTTMSHTLAVLERHELIRFAPNPRDKRSKCVMLTDKGRAFREDAISGLGPDLVRVAEAISAEDVSAVLPVLQELRAFLDREREGQADLSSDLSASAVASSAGK